MERTTKQPIIADTSGLVSLATDTDQNHEPATKAAAKLHKTARPILLPFDILVETVNILGKKSGHEIARKAANELLHPESQFLLIETGPYLFTALEKFKDQPPAVSLTDCIVMSIADDYGTKEIFGFDKQFADAGYTRLEPSTDWKQKV
jgi:predicted nucleic acid-binding protein